MYIVKKFFFNNLKIRNNYLLYEQPQATSITEAPQQYLAEDQSGFLTTSTPQDIAMETENSPFENNSVLTAITS